ncbi:anillin isoform X2 [Venturia canescens]|uniref:anillin isoform X2 n=1 Tax=Venturia canescens TaxID=32260 RepID=UPI001C9D4505|nr:anillin-like isoform X2 [Venturia canescens]
MDPFTQRMLERAKARREKLDTQLSNAGHDLKKRRSPLKDANAILAQAPVQTVSKTVAKSPVSSPAAKQSPAKSPRKTVSPAKIAVRENSLLNKENGNNAVTSARSKLQRLGHLYSDDSSRELSSPIHKNEEKFTAEDEPHEARQPPKSKARLNRLAALASEINNWEDDLSHPSLVKPVESKAEKIQAKMNEQVKLGYDPQPGTSGCSRWKSNSSPNKKTTASPSKPLKWDKSVLDTLESQGYTRTKSNSRLVYDYKNCSQESKASSRVKDEKETTEKVGIGVKSSPMKGEKRNNNSESTGRSPIAGTSKNKAETMGTPEKTSATARNQNNSGVSNNRIGTRFGGGVYNCSPKSPIKSSPGSVLSKASLFESKVTENTRARDPAEMTLTERMALFEKNNKGEAPLIPKAPLTSSVPTKKLLEREKSNSETSQKYSNPDNSGSQSKNGTSLKSVNANRAVFEQGHPTQELENNILRKTQIERQRELDMLRSRFNRNKEMAQAAAGSCIRTSESSEVKSNSPKSSPVCPVKPTPALVKQFSMEQVPPPPPLPGSQSHEQRRGSQMKGSPTKRQVVGSPPKFQQKSLSDVKRIRVSPPKPGHLYPDLSSIETTETETETEYTVGTTEPETATCEEATETETEAEYCVENEDDDYDSYEESEEPITSLERSILRAVNQQAMNKKRSIDPDPDSTVSDISVLDEMDEYLDECLARQEAESEHGPTPPKLNRAGKSPSSASTSFKYAHGSAYRSPIKVTPTRSPRRGEQYVVDGESCIPLMHSVSFYRKQQSQTPKTPIRHVTRVNEMDSDRTSGTNSDERTESTLVQEKIKRLMDEVCKQQTIIGQASQALNLCHATVEFTGSREQVEGERLLLVATHRRQAALNEIQRLKVEGTLRPVVPGSSEVQESGSLTISALTLPLKRDYFRNVDSDTCLHFVCLVRYLENIVVTPVVQAENGDACVRFPSTLKLEDLFSDFKITIEVYSLETRAEVLPHEIKYHIHNNGNSGNHSGVSKKSGGKTPKKFLKQESRLIMPSVQSPAGPGAVRTPAFAPAGYVIFSLKEVNRQQFTLNKVPKDLALEGKLQMHVACELSVSVEHRGFLTMFEDVSGFGAWHRRWCLLKGAILSYWKYPDDERKKTPIGSIELQGITTTNVGLVSRDICARPNTFLLESIRPAQPGDTESLVLVRNGSQTTIRHLLSADTKEDRLEWCSKLNKTINLIHAWGGNATS